MTRIPFDAPRRIWVFLICLLLLVKALFVFGLGDVFFYGEELEKGASAKALLDRVDLPYHQFAYHFYEGGGFVISHLKALAFLCVGESVFAHKLVAMVICAAVFVAGLVLVARHFGDRSAVVFGLLFVFGPASFQKLVLLNLGIHFEATLFLLIVFDRTMRLIFEPEPPRVRDLAVLGLASGFGIYFSYQMALVVGWAGLGLLCLRRGAVFSKVGFVGALALAVGLAPLAAMASRVGLEVFNVHGTQLVARSESVAKIAQFLRSLYVDAESGMPPGVLAPAADPAALAGAYLYPLALLAAVLYGLFGELGSVRWRYLFLTGFLLLWSGVYASSAFVQGAVYHDFLFLRFAPIWVVGTVLVSGAIGRALDGFGRGRLLAQPMFAVLLALGLLNAVCIFAEGSPRTLAHNARVLFQTKGYDYAGYFAKLLPRLPGDARERLAPLLAFEESDRRLLYAELATEAFRRDERGFEHVTADLQALDAEGWKRFMEGIGPYALRTTGGDLAAAFEAAGLAAREMVEGIAFGLGRAGSGLAFTEDAVRAEVEAALVSVRGPAMRWYLRGTGYRLYRNLVVGPFGGVRTCLKPWEARKIAASLLTNSELNVFVVEGFDGGAQQHALE